MVLKLKEDMKEMDIVSTQDLGDSVSDKLYSLAYLAQCWDGLIYNYLYYCFEKSPQLNERNLIWLVRASRHFIPEIGVKYWMIVIVFILPFGAPSSLIKALSLLI